MRANQEWLAYRRATCRILLPRMDTDETRIEVAVTLVLMLMLVIDFQSGIQKTRL
jgi:hypothetical protein